MTLQTVCDKELPQNKSPITSLQRLPLRQS
jgi:hypothetical protein